MGWERSALGYPISDETDEVDGTGRFNLFEHGSIHWKRATGAITVNVNAAILLGPGKSGVDRTGSDLTSFNLPAANPAMCQQSCADNVNCRSWAYVNPGVQGAQARCWLKDSMPLEHVDDCCTAGIKVDVHPSNMPILSGRVDRPGSDFTNFNLPDNDYRLCQGECARNATCRAWTYVDPGVQGPQARCWLKSAIPAPTQSDCCVSGSK
jgi:PAN domain/LGFP repeat